MEQQKAHCKCRRKRETQRAHQCFDALREDSGFREHPTGVDSAQ